MPNAKASIEASMDGSQVVSEANKIDSSLGRVGSTVGTKLGGALKTVGGALGGVIKGGLAAAGVFQSINLARAVDDAKRLDAVTARLGQSMGKGGDQLKQQFEGLERRALTSAPALADFTKQLGRATYDAKGSALALAGLSDEALATGRSVEEQLDLGKTLRNGLGVIGDTTAELGRLRDMAEQFGTTGGHSAFLDTLTAISSELEQVNNKTDQARGKNEAVIGALTKGMSPERAKSVAAGIIPLAKSRALDLQRVSGEKIWDKDGTIDLHKFLTLYKKWSAVGKTATQRERSLMNGPAGFDLGLAIENVDLNEIDRVSASAKDRGKTGREADSFRNTPEGKREELRIQKEQTERQAGGALLGVQDAMVNALGSTGALVAELGLGSLSLGGLVAGGKAAVGALAGTGAAAGGAGASAGLGGSLAAIMAEGGAGAAAAAEGGLFNGSLLASGGTALAGVGGVLGLGALSAGKVLSEVGVTTEVDGDRWRKGHAQTIGAEMAQRAVTAGVITPSIYGLGGGDKDATVEMLRSLEARFEQLNETLKTQVAAGLATELRRAPIVLRMPSDPNNPPNKGNH